MELPRASDDALSFLAVDLPSILTDVVLLLFFGAKERAASSLMVVRGSRYKYLGCCCSVSLVV